ncbi:MAG TPA: PAS domain-containing sensor histidine kinase [Rhodothermales bacterium]|nr:PAS domain-containing sensor histidine kinase [Rhodothermales bacterium]
MAWLLPWLRALRGRRGPQGSEQPEIALVDFLCGQISTPRRAGGVLSAVAAFRQLPREKLSGELPGIYLLLEQYLTDIDQLKLFTRAELREVVSERFPQLASSECLGLIFEPPLRQEVLLCRAFLLDALRRALLIMGGGEGLLASTRDWITSIPDRAGRPVPFGLTNEIPATEGAWLALLMRLSNELYQHLGTNLGEANDRIYDSSYAHIARRYVGLETFPIVIRLLPDGLLDEQKIQSLSRHSALERAQGALSDAQRAALDTAAQLQAVLNTVGEGIITVDSQGVVVLVNREIERIFGYSQSELLGTRMSQLLARAPMMLDGGGLPFADEADLWESMGQRAEADGIRKDGSIFPVELCINETQISGQLFYTAALRDITGRKDFEQELVDAKEHAEEMTRLKTAFLANISHELRTPLTGIMGFAQVLGEEVSDEQREFTHLIHESGRRLLDTLNSVLEFAQLESGAAEVNREPVDVAAHVEQVMTTFGARAAEKNVALVFDSPEEPVTAELDPAYLDRILTHLIENAVKFTPHGKVSVALSAEWNRVCIQVADTGIGISPEFLPRLFDEFRQESVGLSRSHGGAGLGLAITKRLVEIMGGRIAAESEKGQGSTFTISLPVHVQTTLPAARPVERSFVQERERG